MAKPNDESKTTDFTLCWDCENATKPHVCPWVRDGTQVPGWIAKHKRIRFSGVDGSGKKFRRVEDSFTVYECPLFKRDSWRGGQVDCEDNTHHVKDFAVTRKEMRVIAARIITRAVEDWKALDYGRIRSLPSIVRVANSDELREFFHSEYFEELLALCTSTSPHKVREILRVGDA